MSKVTVYNQEGNNVGDVELPAQIFGVKISPELVQQAVVRQQANSRQVIAHTKGRSDVRGGGRKPWAQKGTGRARHGSIRSPLWAGGGVTFGPSKERNFSKRMNRKAKKKALLMALSDRAREKKVVVVDNLKLAEIKTKTLMNILNKLPIKNNKTLVIVPETDKIITKSANNLPMVETCQADNLNILQVLNAEYLLIAKDSILKMKKTYFKKEDVKK
ncbi:50S ribosomal protein L4 [Patescibacteria group bacterium]|nr:50S ribosomal protein L4 [Patescibacteria group bacterium]MBU1074887.1 50S ribosomal protein L4 [Patescibacteria group bacterium]MBU1951397.1 50S ribosomal protein L4 [Patescibacteria group bacterium]MBU2229458.1 50S ribosomal protein L4 [Patescibacteria group bacterium]